MNASTTYPADFQNLLKGQGSEFLRRGMTSIKEPAGGILFNNTQDEQVLTYYYRDGGFLQFDKFRGKLYSGTDFKTEVIGNTFEHIGGNKSSHASGTRDEVNLGDVYHKTGDVDKAHKYAEDFLKKQKKLHGPKRCFDVMRSKQAGIDNDVGQQKLGILAPCPSEEIEVKSLYTAVAMEWINAFQFVDCVQIPAQLIPHEVVYENRTDGGWPCLTCWGTGESPSSQDGIWTPDPIKKIITATIVNLTNTLSNSEKQLGSSKHPESGTEIRKSSKNVVETIGSVFNTLESYRKDPKGKVVPYGYKVDPFGLKVYPQFRETPLIEQVHSDPMPGGQYHLNVCDRYTLSVGANGMSMKTNGNIDMFGIQTTLNSERTSINARSEIVLGAERIDISADVISFRPRKCERKIEDNVGKDRPVLDANGKPITEPEQQMVIEGNLNVGLNAIIAGGAHIEGEVTLQHITAPCEYQITDTDFEGPTGKDTDTPTEADLLEGKDIGILVEGVVTTGLGKGGLVTGLVKSLCCPSCIVVHPHRHWFKNLPLKLIRDDVDLDVTVGEAQDVATVDPNSAVRAVGARNNFALKNQPMCVKHSEDELTVLEKFEE